MEIFKALEVRRTARAARSRSTRRRATSSSNEYLREVRKVGGQLANVEIETARHRGEGPLEGAAEEGPEEITHTGRSFVFVCRKRRLPRRRLRHDPVRHLRRPVGDDGPDGLRQPRPRRVRHGRAASSSSTAMGRLGRAVPAGAAGRVCRRSRLQAWCWSACSTRASTPRASSRRCSSRIGLIFVSMAVARLDLRRPRRAGVPARVPAAARCTCSAAISRPTGCS